MKLYWIFLFCIINLISGILFSGEIKNVILMIPDGTSLGAVNLARWYQGGSPLVLDGFYCGLVRTYSSDAIIADSAPAATAMATGILVL